MKKLKLEHFTKLTLIIAFIFTMIRFFSGESHTISIYVIGATILFSVATFWMWFYVSNKFWFKVIEDEKETDWKIIHKQVSVVWSNYFENNKNKFVLLWRSLLALLLAFILTKTMFFLGYHLSLTNSLDTTISLLTKAHIFMQFITFFVLMTWLLTFSRIVSYMMYNTDTK